MDVHSSRLDKANSKILYAHRFPLVGHGTVYPAFVPLRTRYTYEQKRKSFRNPYVSLGYSEDTGQHVDVGDVTGVCTAAACSLE